MKKPFKFKCLECDYTWADSDHGECPKCDGLYVEWLNYDPNKEYK
jgi:rubrerythrin